MRSAIAKTLREARVRPRAWAARSALVVVVLGMAGLAAAALGLASVAASSGHWPVTDWFLHFAMRRAVVMRALGIETPPLDDASMIVLGAEHYSTGCAGCHGEPGAARPRVPAQMTPPPPDLAERALEWRPRELFWIVKHGIKFTGMPGWAALGRDEEVWAVVAFLRRLPALTPAEYRSLVRGAAPSSPFLPRPDLPPAGLEAIGADGEPAIAGAGCDRCHEREGIDTVPRLAGLARPYLLATLAAYAQGHRQSGVMEPVAARLDAPAMQRLAEHYSQRARAPAAVPGAPLSAAAERGRRIAETGVPERAVPACRYCHGPNPTARNGLFPELAGQPARWLETQLELWVEEGGRGGTEYAHVMAAAVERLPRSAFGDLAAYYSELEPDP